jgi:hypothetical protein
MSKPRKSDKGEPYQLGRLRLCTLLGHSIRSFQYPESGYRPVDGAPGPLDPTLNSATRHAPDQVRQWTSPVSQWQSTLCRGDGPARFRISGPAIGIATRL